jgi:hypothetical protein
MGVMSKFVTSVTMTIILVLHRKRHFLDDKSVKPIAAPITSRMRKLLGDIPTESPASVGWQDECDQVGLVTQPCSTTTGGHDLPWEVITADITTTVYFRKLKHF